MVGVVGTAAAASLAERLGGLQLGVGDRETPPPLAGCAPLLAALAETIAWPHTHADAAAALGLAWPRGLLIHGPPGTGKTAAVKAAAAAAGALLLTISPGGLFGPFVGDSERRLRTVWAKANAAAAAQPGRPVVILLDDAHVLAPARSAAGPHEGRVVAQLLTLLDGAAAGGSGGGGDVAARRTVSPAVIATTSRPGALDPALRRAGRLDREVAVGLPSVAERAAILALHTARLPLAADVNVGALAAKARGLSGADLAAVAREAARGALTDAARAECEEEAKTTSASTPSTPPRPVCAADFEAALVTVGASATRGLRPLELPPAAWTDVGGLEEVKARLTSLVAWPLTRAPAFARLGLRPPCGVLLYGPPGCSKTTLARAAATAAGAPLHALSGAALFSAYLGEGEATLRAAFAAARAACPAVVFLDEVDALGGKRSAGGAGDPGDRMLAALLAELDGLEATPGLLVLAATNRPHALDAALLRPGRLDAHVYVPPPDADGRAAALRVHTRGMPLAGGVDLGVVGAAWLAEGLTGAEVAGVAREAALAAAREGAAEVGLSHFEAAAAAARPGVNPAELEAFEAWGRRGFPGGGGGG
jgi:SpoVK/Ycf46/Vps4 family AAA+-type ATPase